MTPHIALQYVVLCFGQRHFLPTDVHVREHLPPDGFMGAPGVQPAMIPGPVTETATHHGNCAGGSISSFDTLFGLVEARGMRAGHQTLPGALDS